MKSEPETSWESLLEDLYEPIFRFTLQFLGNRAEAEDATQETFARAFRMRGTLRDDTRHKPWLYQIARNICIDRKRWWKRWHLVSEDVLTERIGDELEGFSKRLSEVLMDLPIRQREIFVLRHLHGFSTNEVAELCQVSPGTVKSHLFRAIEKIRREL